MLQGFAPYRNRTVTLKPAAAIGLWRSLSCASFIPTFITCGGQTAEDPPVGHPAGSDGTAARDGSVAQAGSCGNGRRDPGEACDGDDFGGQTCATITMSMSAGGTLHCNEKCEVDTSGCSMSPTGPPVSTCSDVTPCSLGWGCLTGSECLSGVCQRNFSDGICTDCTSGLCRPFVPEDAERWCGLISGNRGFCVQGSCGNGVTDGAESDIDCGGSRLCETCPDETTWSCLGCPPGSRCTDDYDCVTLTCRDGICVNSG